MASNEKLGSKKTEQEEVSENFVTKTIAFFNKYQNIIYGVIIGILVVVLAIILFNKFYLQKKNGEASAQMSYPISQLMAGDSASLNRALEGNDENDGFLSIADGYKLTKTSNTAKYYAGLCYLKLGQKDEAMDYLKKFKKREDVLWYGCQSVIGDLYDEQGDEAAAVKYYEKAAKGEDPYFTPIALFKLAQMYERQDKWNEAADTYQKIEDNFYAEYTKMSIAQYAERAKAKASK
ncbi:MAG: tetratricopeptide repeat protein [Bacteroidales bacterium]|nr:tetratricopeptide repeat protein [Bacteroidales bacterium]